MPHDQPDPHDTRPAKALGPCPTDALGWPIPIFEAAYRAGLPAEMVSLHASWDIPADEIETEEVWDEILRNLGVDPVSGRGLES